MLELYFWVSQFGAFGVLGFKIGTYANANYHAESEGRLLLLVRTKQICGRSDSGSGSGIRVWGFLFRV